MQIFFIIDGFIQHQYHTEQGIFKLYYNQIYGYSFLSIYKAGLLKVNETINNNYTVMENSTVLYWITGNLVMNAGELRFEKNECQDFSDLMQTFYANMKFDNESFLTITFNYMHRAVYSQVLAIHKGSLKMSLNSTMLVSKMWL